MNWHIQQTQLKCIAMDHHENVHMTIMLMQTLVHMLT